MRKTTLAGFALLFGFAGVAAADCLSPSITAAGQIRGVIVGNTVCANLGSERWQEYHSGSGNSGALIDYKKGPSDPVDPSKTVGSWSISGGQVIYNYGSGGTYAYTLHNNGGGSYTFCGARNIDATFRPGQGAC